METLILIIANAVVMLCVLCAWRLTKEHTWRIKQLESVVLATQVSLLEAQTQIETLAGCTEQLQEVVLRDAK